MKRALAIIGFAAFGTTALLAQQHNADTDKMIGGGSLPAGWSVRLDSGGTRPEGVSVTPMGGGIHFKTGPAGVYYRATDTKTGSYEVHGSFNQVEPAAHPEAYGLVVGGSNLAGPTQKYTYFLVRQDGKFMISRRDGAKVTALVPWTDHASVKKTEGSTKGTNMLSIVVAPDKTRFVVNGAEVNSQPSASIDASGIAGLRINHNLNVHVDGFGVK
jgi:hypothetical protein